MLFTKLQNLSKSSTANTSNDVILEIVKEKLEDLSKSNDSMQSVNKEQGQILNEEVLKLEKRFGLLQIDINKTMDQSTAKIKEGFIEQSKNQIEHYSKLQQHNSETLQKMQESLNKKLSDDLQTLQNSNSKNFEVLSKHNEEKLTQIQQGVETRLDENLKKNLESFQVVQKNLVQMQGAAEKMIESTKSVDKLNNIFERTSSKGFGDFGEKFLESFLSENLMANSWQKQVSAPGSNDKIDFVVTFGERKLGIDSKFPLTKYRDYLDTTGIEKAKKYKEFLSQVKNMAQSISKKYGKSGVADNLMIYFPSDGMYVDVVNNEDLIQKLIELEVTPCSPTTIYPLIMMIKDYQHKVHVNKNAQKIIDGLKKIGKNMMSFQDEFRKLGKKIHEAQQNYDKADRSLDNVQMQVLKLDTKQIENEEEKQKLI